MEVKEGNPRLETRKRGTHLKSCQRDTGENRVKAEAAPESPCRRGLGSAPQTEGRHQALSYQEEFGRLMAHGATMENEREKTRRVGLCGEGIVAGRWGSFVCLSGPALRMVRGRL